MYKEEEKEGAREGEKEEGRLAICAMKYERESLGCLEKLSAAGGGPSL